MEEARKRVRRRHDERLKRQVLEECSAAGASVAKVAMAHGLNANLVHKWRRTAGELDVPPTESFIPVMLAAPAPAADEQPTTIDLELQRGPVCVKVSWPITSAAACAAWLREILR